MTVRKRAASVKVCQCLHFIVLVEGSLDDEDPGKLGSFAGGGLVNIWLLSARRRVRTLIFGSAWKGLKSYEWDNDLRYQSLQVAEFFVSFSIEDLMRHVTVAADPTYSSRESLTAQWPRRQTSHDVGFRQPTTAAAGSGPCSCPWARCLCQLSSLLWDVRCQAHRRSI